MSKILTCNCTNSYQDKKYGTSKRVANKTHKGTATQDAYRCTSCETLLFTKK